MMPSNTIYSLIYKLHGLGGYYFPRKCSRAVPSNTFSIQNKKKHTIIYILIRTYIEKWGTGATRTSQCGFEGGSSKNDRHRCVTFLKCKLRTSAPILGVS